MSSPDLARIPEAMLQDLYMVRKAKQALAKGLCPDCGQVLEVVDTWERACPAAACGYTFNYYHWPWITAELPPEDFSLG